MIVSKSNPLLLQGMIFFLNNEMYFLFILFFSPAYLIVSNIRFDSKLFSPTYLFLFSIKPQCENYFAVSVSDFFLLRALAISTHPRHLLRTKDTANPHAIPAAPSPPNISPLIRRNARMCSQILDGSDSAYSCCLACAISVALLAFWPQAFNDAAPALQREGPKERESAVCSIHLA